MKRLRQLLSAASSAIPIGLMSVGSASAQEATFEGIKNPVTGNLGNNATDATSGVLFVDYFIFLWNVVMLVGGLVVLVYFIQAAIEWITAGGDSGKIQKARDRMIQSFIGLFILVFSFIIINFIGNLLFGESFEILKPVLPTANDL